MVIFELLELRLINSRFMKCFPPVSYEWWTCPPFSQIGLYLSFCSKLICYSTLYVLWQPLLIQTFQCGNKDLSTLIEPSSIRWKNTLEFQCQNSSFRELSTSNLVITIVWFKWNTGDTWLCFWKRTKNVWFVHFGWDSNTKKIG